MEHEEKRRWATGLLNLVLTEIISQGKYAALDDAFT